MVEAATRLEPTPLSELYVKDMGVEQIWSQLELRAKTICELVDLVFEGEYPDPEELLKSVTDEKEEADEMEIDEEDRDMKNNQEKGDEDQDEEESSEDEDLGEHIMTLSGEAPKPKRNGPSVHLNRKDLEDRPARPRKGPKHPVLDDDFFSIQEFNRETEGAEARSSTRGRLKKAGSDDEDEDDNDSVDLFADVGEDVEDAGSDEDGDGNRESNLLLSNVC